METKQESLSVKTPIPVKICASLPAEIRHILTVFAVFAASVQVYCMTSESISLSYANRCVLSVLWLAALYSVLLFLFRMLTGNRASLFAVTVCAAFLAFLLKNREIINGKTDDQALVSAGMLALIGYVFWLFFKLTKDKRYISLVFILLSDAIMIYAWSTSIVFGETTFTGKLVFAALFVLSLAHIRWKYPFAFFAGLLVFLLVIPVRKDPIDWTPLVNAGIYVVDKTKDIAGTISYYFSDLKKGHSYQSGYSSLAQTGGSITLSDHTELEIKTRENMTFIYTDENTGQRMKRRRTLYLTGGEALDHDRLLDIVFSLYAHDIDNVEAGLFTRTTRLEITYMFLKTRDAIAPECAISLTDEEGNVPAGKSITDHRKGYTLDSVYLDLDYGNPYLAQVMSSPITSVKKESVSYYKMDSYLLRICGVRLTDLISEDEYAAWQAKNGSYDEYLDIKGVSNRMKDLATEITKDCKSDYEKCKAIESYLRQYKYSTNIGYQSGGDSGSAQGMSRLADEFIFEKGAGYCVHYTSAMVMLLRLNGIPAKYTSGYRYIFPIDRQPSYEVYGKYAHAWPEAYISGFGWVPFEPTSAMSTAEERTWHRRLSSLEAAKEGYDEMEGSNVPYPGAGSLSPYPTPAVSAEYETMQEETNLRGFLDIAFILLTVLGAVLLLALMILLFSMFYRYIKYKRSDRAKRIIMDVSDMTALISRMADGQLSDRGIMSDYSPFVPDKYRESAQKVFEIYYRIKYRCTDDDKGEKVTDLEEEMARKLRNDMYSEYGHRLKGFGRIMNVLYIYRKVQ